MNIHEHSYIHRGKITKIEHSLKLSSHFLATVSYGTRLIAKNHTTYSIDHTVLVESVHGNSPIFVIDATQN